MDFVTWVTKFYKENEKLAIALVSLLGGVLLTQVFPKVLTIISKIIDLIGNKLGGVFAYKVFEGKYLNWVVMQNQTLNLTGMIGTGEKPFLEDVFISLRITDRKQLPEDDKENVKELSLIEEIQNTFSDRFTKDIEKTRNILPSKKRFQFSIFQPSRLWKLRLIFERDNFDILYYWLITIPLLVLPGLYLLSPSTDKQNLLTLLSALVLSLFPVLVLFILLDEGVKNQNTQFWIEGIVGWFVLPVLSIVYVIWRSFLANQGLKHMVSGVGIGAAIALIIYFINYLNNGGTDLSRLRSVGEFLSLGKSLAILGKPGSGKSTYFQFIALAFGREKAGDKQLRKSGFIKRSFGISEWYLPILIPLRRISSHLQTNIKSDDGMNVLLDAFRKKVLPSDLRDGFSNDYIRYMLKRKKVLFLFDGLDEVASDNDFEMLVNEIKGLVSIYPGNRYIISSRYSGWRGGAGLQFIETEIKDLDNNQIDNFIKTWYRAIEINRLSASSKNSDSKKRFSEERAREKGNSLRQTLRSTESVRTLASNPLLLSLICFVHYNKTLPKERLSLYQDCSKLLLEQWEVEKGILENDIPLTFVRKEIIMQKVALTMHSGTISNSGNPRETTKGEILTIIRDALEKFDIPTEEAEELFEKLVARTGLLIPVEQYKDTYQFSHLTFQEYYAAGYIYEKGLNIISVIQKSNYGKPSHLANWWREVILLYSSMKRNPSELIGQLLKKDTSDYFQVQLQLAAQCVVDAVEKPVYKIEQQVIEELWNIRTLKKIVFSPDKNYAEVKNYLLKFSSSDEYYEYVIKNKVKTSTRKNIKMHIEKFRDEIETNNDNLRNAICVGYEQIWCKFDLSGLLGENEINKFLEHGDLDLILKVTNCVGNRKIESLQDKLIEKVVESTVNFIIEVVRDEKNNIEYFDEDGELVRLILEEIKSETFVDHWGSIKGKLANTLFEIFADLPEYRTDATAPKKALLEFVLLFFRFLIHFDTEIENDFHKSQLMDMVKMGNTNQQIWGILLLSNIYSDDSDVWDLVVSKLTAPYVKVRLSALSALFNLARDDKRREILCILTNVSANLKNYKSVGLRFKKRLNEIVLGRGILGSSIEELIIIEILNLIWRKDRGQQIITILGELSESEFKNTIYLWIDALAKLVPILTEKEVDQVMQLSKKIEDDRLLDLFSLLLESADNLSSEALLTICEEIGKNKKYKTFRLLNAISKKDKVAPEVCEVLVKKLTDGLYIESSAAFNILLLNKCI